MIGRLVRPLDRYVFGEFFRIFLTTALGFPILLVVIDLTDNIERYLTARIPGRDIALSYLYFLPESAFMVIPAAVLFATVFTIGGMTRHSEIAAAKASGISFYRMIVPIMVGALLATGIDLVVGELMPVTSRKRIELLEGTVRGVSATSRYNFAFASEYGRAYKIGELHSDSGVVRAMQVERRGVGADYPTYLLAAQDARYDAATARWTLGAGEMNVIADTNTVFSVAFEQAWDRRFAEMPVDMMARPRSPQEMRYEELTRFIRALERSGGDANALRVDRSMKLAIPITCLIIALFGAPLATSSQRGGTAYGVAVSLATTVTFLLLIQLTRAIGAKAVIPPDLAAWTPGALFLVVGLVLMARVRT
jgi:lipopolysaccharide export system permease protein